MVQVKTPEQLEDAAITDAIRSVVGVRTRAQFRELQNRLAETLAPKIEAARLNGRRVDVEKLISEALRETTNA